MKFHHFLSDGQVKFPGFASAIFFAKKASKRLVAMHHATLKPSGRSYGSIQRDKA
jgi:hypothetical protein